MFDLIKLLVEKVIGTISYDSIAERRKQEKLTDIGTELMLLFMSLNGVVVVGEKIVGILREMAATKDQERCFSASKLKELVRKQAEQLIMVIASCCRLRKQLGVIDESGGRVLAQLLHIKFGLLRNQLCELWPGLSSPSDGTSQLLQHFDFEHGKTTYLRSFSVDDLEHILVSGSSYDVKVEASKRAWDSGIKLPLDGESHREIAQRFLDAGAEDNLEAIATSAQALREQIATHFSLTDVLLKVNDSRGVESDPSRVLWEIRRHNV